MIRATGTAGAGTATAAWVGEGAAKPVTSMSFNTVELGWYKVACIAVITEELIRFSSPSAERLVREELARAVIERLDTDFINPAKAAVTGVSPASILNGVSGIPSTGTDAPHPTSVARKWSNSLDCSILHQGSRDVEHLFPATQQIAGKGHPMPT